MIMIIFGAGASYDSVPSRPPDQYRRGIAGQWFSRPQLDNELFLPPGFLAESLRRFPQCKPVVPYLQSIPEGITLEHRLEELQTEGDEDPQRRIQINAIRFYLHDVIRECERNW